MGFSLSPHLAGKEIWSFLNNSLPFLPSLEPGPQKPFSFDDFHYVREGLTSPSIWSSDCSLCVSWGHPAPQYLDQVPLAFPSGQSLGRVGRAWRCGLVGFQVSGVTVTSCSASLSTWSLLLSSLLWCLLTSALPRAPRLGHRAFLNFPPNQLLPEECYAWQNFY